MIKNLRGERPRTPTVDPAGVEIAREHLPPGYRLEVERDGVTLASPFGWRASYASPWNVIDLLEISGDPRTWIRSDRAHDGPRETFASSDGIFAESFCRALMVA